MTKLIGQCFLIDTLVFCTVIFRKPSRALKHVAQ